MAAELIVLPKADQDSADACQWLERRDPGLGKEFLRSLEAAFETIAQSPEGFSRSLEDCRHHNLRRFPCGLFHDYVADEVVAYAVFHRAQSPAALRKKLWLRKPM